MNNERERVELHAHTNMSKLGGIDSTEELLRYALNTGLSGLAITDVDTVAAYPAAARFNERMPEIKIIYGVEVYVDLCDFMNSNFKYNITVLVKKQEGIPILYKLMSEAALSNKPIGYSELKKYSNYFLFGSGIASSFLYASLFAGLGDKKIKKRMELFDYIEVLPPSALPYPRCSGMGGDVWKEEKYTELTERLVNLAEKMGKTVVAVSDSRCASKYDLESCYALMWNTGELMRGDRKTIVYLRSTAEMLDEFSFLGNEKAWEIVVDNTNLIADKIEPVRPVKMERQYPEIKDAYKDIEKCVYSKNKEIYGDILPQGVSERISHELEIIKKNGYASYFRLWQLLVEFSRKHKCYYYARGVAGSSYVAFSLGISDVNPLPEEYGGCNIPFESMVGLSGEKFPDIDINFSSDMKELLIDYLKSIFGEKSVLKAGVIGRATNITAEKWMREYLKDNIALLLDEEIEYLTNRIIGVKRTIGQHPGGVIIVPADTDIYEYTPRSYLQYGKDEKIEITHFDYHELMDKLLKIDILGSDASNILSEFWKRTGVNPFDIDLRKVSDECKEKDINIDFDLPLFKYLPNKRQNKDEISYTREDILDLLTGEGIPFETAYVIMDEVRRGRVKSGKCKNWKEYKQLIEEHLLKFSQDDAVSKGDIIKWMEKTDSILSRAHEQSKLNTILRLKYYKMNFLSEYKSVICSLFNN